MRGIRNVLPPMVTEIDFHVNIDFTRACLRYHRKP
ncbi:hypothetical protein HD883_005005 [Pigmentiphaga litoralis]|nr:hypothetical protein [Pigmentiphaga litoralis]